MQPRFLIEILPRKAQVDADVFAVIIRITVGYAIAKAVTVPAPDDALVTIGGQSGGIQMIGVQAAVQVVKIQKGGYRGAATKVLNPRLTLWVIVPDGGVVLPTARPPPI